MRSSTCAVMRALPVPNARAADLGRSRFLASTADHFWSSPTNRPFQSRSALFKRAKSSHSGFPATDGAIVARQFHNDLITPIEIAVGLLLTKAICNRSASDRCKITNQDSPVLICSGAEVRSPARRLEARERSESLRGFAWVGRG
jgi:hypothetical protein